MVVQRKWMYLESIFIGGDIRAQLPEEAKKFDDIDKTFKKVRNPQSAWFRLLLTDFLSYKAIKCKLVCKSQMLRHF